LSATGRLVALLAAWRDGLQPVPALTVSRWADRHGMLSPPGAPARPGPWAIPPMLVKPAQRVVMTVRDFLRLRLLRHSLWRRETHRLRWRASLARVGLHQRPAGRSHADHATDGRSVPHRPIRSYCFAIDCCSPLQLPNADLVLGVWLGDGSSIMNHISVEKSDVEIAEHLRACGVDAEFRLPVWRKDRCGNIVVDPTWRLGGQATCHRLRFTDRLRMPAGQEACPGRLLAAVGSSGSSWCAA
jgi:hypothetical protein